MYLGAHYMVTVGTKGLLFSSNHQEKNEQSTIGSL